MHDRTHLPSVIVGLLLSLLIAATLNLAAVALDRMSLPRATLEQILLSFGDNAYEIGEWEHIRDKDGVRTVITWKRRAPK